MHWKERSAKAGITWIILICKVHRTETSLRFHPSLFACSETSFAVLIYRVKRLFQCIVLLPISPVNSDARYRLSLVFARHLGVALLNLCLFFQHIFFSRVLIIIIVYCISGLIAYLANRESSVMSPHVKKRD